MKKPLQGINNGSQAHKHVGNNVVLRINVSYMNIYIVCQLSIMCYLYCLLGHHGSSLRFRFGRPFEVDFLVANMKIFLPQWGAPECTSSFGLFHLGKRRHLNPAFRSKGVPCPLNDSPPELGYRKRHPHIYRQFWLFEGRNLKLTSEKLHTAGQVGFNSCCAVTVKITTLS